MFGLCCSATLSVPVGASPAFAAACAAGFSTVRPRCKAAGPTTRPESAAVCGPRHRPTDPPAIPVRPRSCRFRRGLAEGTTRLSGDEDFPRHEPATADPRRSERRHLRGRELGRADPRARPSTGCRLSTRPRVRDRPRPPVRDLLLPGRVPAPLCVRGREQPGDPLSLYGGRSGSSLRCAGDRAQAAAGCRPVTRPRALDPRPGVLARRQTLFVSVGSDSNVSDDEDETAGP